MQVLQVKFKKLSQDAQAPSIAYAEGLMDLHATSNIHRDATKGFAVIGTGLAMEIPEGFVGLVFSRSGQGFKHDIRLSNCVGVIDADYRGEVCVKLASDSFAGDDYILGLRPGDAIAQMLIIPKPYVQLEEVDELSSTDRGSKGFGSSKR